MEVKSEISSIEALVPKIDESRNYWLIRTKSGKYYRPFLSNNVITIGYELVTAPLLKDIFIRGVGDRRDRLREQIERLYPDNKVPGIAASQLFRFYSEIRKGDVIIAPSAQSEELSFGIIQDNEPFAFSYPRENRTRNNQKDDQEDELLHNKARRVKWVKSTYKSLISPYMLGLFFVHQTIVNAKEYASLIDSSMHDFYIKGTKCHLRLRVEREHDIKARNLFKLCLELQDLADDFLKNVKVDKSTEDSDVKITLQSPGDLEFINIGFEGLFIIGLIIVGLAGGGLEGKWGGHSYKVKSDGIIKRLSEYISARKKDKFLIEAMNKLSIQDPKEIIEIVKKLIGKQ